MAPPRRPWFRLYTEVLHDRKIRRIDPAHRWLWIAVLAAARQSPEPGVLLIDHGDPLTVDDLADLAALPARTVTAGIASFGDMIEWDEARQCWWIPKFRERQYESDVSTERVTKHRRSNGDVTPNETGKQQPQRDREQSPENRTHKTTMTTTVGCADGASSSSSYREEVIDLAARALAESRNQGRSYARGIARNLATEPEHVRTLALALEAHPFNVIDAAIAFVGADLGPFVRHAANPTGDTQ